MATVVLTRPDGKNQALAQQLQAKGIPSLQLPALELQATLSRLSHSYLPTHFDLLVFVSAQAAQFYLAALDQAQGHFLPNQLIATVGAASAQPFYNRGLAKQVQLIHPPATHPRQDSEALWELLAPRINSFKQVLVVRGQQGREWLSQQLMAVHKNLQRCAIYQRIPAQWSAQDTIQLQSDLVKPQSVTFLLTSSESTRAIHANIVRMGLELQWKQARFVAIHPRIVHALKQCTQLSETEIEKQVVVCAPSESAMLQALLQTATAN